MSLPTTIPSAALATADGIPVIPVTEQARRALQRLLDLGVQVVDGKAMALLEIPSILAQVADGLQGVHGALGALPADGDQVLVPVLAAHAARRKQLGLQELKALTNVVATADRPEFVGRRVVITALVLLSNLESDERWYGSLSAQRRAA
jgi:hypothetical protein